MIDLRVRLKETADWAELHDRHGQDVNQHSDEGDQVIVLNDDAVDKLYERWQDPATVVRIKSPYSYLVDMGDGRVRDVHANKMRKFHVRVQSCNIISKNDVDFSRALVPVLFCSLAVLDPRVGHTMDVLSPFIPVLCHSD